MLDLVIEGRRKDLGGGLMHGMQAWVALPPDDDHEYIPLPNGPPLPDSAHPV